MSTVETVADTVAEKITSAQADLEKLTADLRALLATKEQEFSPEVQNLRRRVEEKLADARETVSHVAHDATVHAREKAALVDRYAHDEPWRVAAGALAVGALLGTLVGVLVASRR